MLSVLRMPAQAHCSSWLQCRPPPSPSHTQFPAMPAAHPLHVRVASVVAYILCFHIAIEYGWQAFWLAFVACFEALEPTHQVGATYLRRFAGAWVSQFIKLGHVLERRRQRHKMPDSVVERIGNALLEGYDVLVEVGVERGVPVMEVRHRWYRSIGEFVGRNEWVDDLLKQHGEMTLRTLRRRLHQVMKGKLRKRWLHPRAPLTEEHKWERLNLCYRLLGMGVSTGVDPLLHYLSRVCWIDAKTYYIEPGLQSVFAPADADMTEVDDRVSRKKWGGPKVHYYCVVNALLGPVYFQYMTGSTAHNEDPCHQMYMVRPPPPPLRFCSPQRLYERV